MTQFISQMATKYHLSEQKMDELVGEVVARIESDLPQDVNQQIDQELAETPIQVGLKKTSVFSIP